MPENDDNHSGAAVLAEARQRIQGALTAEKSAGASIRRRAEERPRHRYRRQSKRATAVGGLLIVAGAVLAAYVGWQFWGTNWTSHRKQEQGVSELKDAWQAGTPAVTVDDQTASALIRVPRFGDDYVIPILEGTSDAALAAGYGHFPRSAGPGEVGNFALAAHRVTHGEPLRQMPELQPGDEVVVETQDHVYTYVLDTGGDDLVVDRSESWVTDPRPTNPDEGETQPSQAAGQRLITLTTCSELFHTDGRMVAFGHLESVDKK